MSIDTHQNLDTLRATMNAWVAAFNAGDVDRLISLYDPEIYYANHGVPTMHGTEVVYNHFKNLLEQVDINATMNEEVALADHNLGYIAGAFEMNVTNKANNETMVETGRVMAVFRKNSAGEWKMIADFDNKYNTPS